MEITVGEYKIRLEILILIVIFLWLLFGTTLFSCSNYSLKETFALARMFYNRTNCPLVGTCPGMGTIRKQTRLLQESFVNPNNSAFEPEFSDSKAPGYISSPETWSMPTLEYTPGTTPSAGVESILGRPKQPVPLPEGQLDFLATTPFKAECCPSAYSTSTGCACITMDQYKYLHERGGNNVPFSQY
jgi:hypothetical protein